MTAGSLTDMSEQHPGKISEKSSGKDDYLDLLKPSVAETTDTDHEAARLSSLEQSRQLVEQSATSSELMNKAEKTPEILPEIQVTTSLKKDGFDRVIIRTRKQLPLTGRILSKVIHQPIIDFLSDAGENTIARPSGLLGGGVVSLLGSGVILYTAKNYGFRYNLLAFFLLFLAGFIIGLFIERLLHYALKLRK